MLTRVLLPSLLLFSSLSMAVDLLPTFNDAYYKDGKLVEKHIGKLIAIDAIVKRIEPGPEKKPILQVKLKGGDSEKQLWVASLANITTKMVPLGSNIRILGYLDETKNETQFIQKLTDDKAYLLGFCFHDMKTNLPSYLTRWLKQCLAWETGENTKDISH